MLLERRLRQRGQNRRKVKEGLKRLVGNVDTKGPEQDKPGLESDEKIGRVGRLGERSSC